MDPAKLKDLRLGNGELYVHDDTDLVDYDRFFEFYLANGEMTGRIDALHSQHVRGGAKKDALCVRLVDLWGEATYPIHRGRPGGRFFSKLENADGEVVAVRDLRGYRQELDPKTSMLRTGYSWRKEADRGTNESVGFMSKVRKHLMVHRYRDTVETAGWSRSFTVETLFPYHSRASAFYYKKPYSPKRWAWGEVEEECEIEPVRNASVSYDPEEMLGVVSFATDFPALRTRVVWAVRPETPPDSWEVDEERGSLTFRWNLKSGECRDTTVYAVVMTDRDDPDFPDRAAEEAKAASEAGWDALEEEHRRWWREELGRSRVALPDATLQKLYDVAMTAMLNNVGGSYWGFIGVDNVIYETCMCDNPVMLHSLVETNHLGEAKRELELLGRYLPAARQNAADRMRVVLGIENEDGALLPFYMTEDGVELWQDNVLGMYTSMSAYHTISLLKTGGYLNDPRFLRETAYPWLRGYAEYGRLHAVWDDRLGAHVFPIQNLGGGGEGCWYRQTMSPRLYKRIFARREAMFRHADFPHIEDFPLEEISELDHNWIDVVTNFRWILDETRRLAEELGLDPQERERWRETADSLHFPQNDRFYLSSIGDEAAPGLGGPAVGTLFWPAEGTPDILDQDKVRRTFDELAGRRHIEGLARRKGRGWDAVNGFQYAYMGRGEESLLFLKSFALASDPRGIQMCEAFGKQNFYYLLGHGTLILLTRYMLLQTYQNRIRLFPAVPEEWRSRGVEFAGFPAGGGILVAAKTGPSSDEPEVKESFAAERTERPISSEAIVSDREGSRILDFRGAFGSLEIGVGNLVWSEGELRFDLKGCDADIEITAYPPERREYRVVVNGEETTLLSDPTLSIAARPPASVRIR